MKLKVMCRVRLRSLLDYSSIKPYISILKESLYIISHHMNIEQFYFDMIMMMSNDRSIETECPEFRIRYLI